MITNLKSAFNDLLVPYTGNITSWVQGSLSQSTGKISSATNRCRSSYIQFNTKNTTVTITVSSGYKIRLLEYSSDFQDYYTGRISGWCENSVNFDVNPDYYYRFVIALSTDADVLPDDIPNNAVSYLELILDNNLIESGKIPDSKSTGDALRRVRYDLISTRDSLINIDFFELYWNDGGPNAINYKAPGNEVTSSGYAHTDYIMVLGFSRIKYMRNSSTAPNPVGMSFYDANYDWISGLRGNAYSSSEMPIIWELNVPDNAVYARFSYREDTITYGEFQIFGLQKTSANINYPNASVSMFEKIGVCGGSWESGLYFYGNDSSNYEQDYTLSWAANLARRNGINYSVYARGGLNTLSWISSQYGLSKLKADTACNLYVTCFGRSNDANRGADKLGTITDIGTNADTYYRYYGDIITEIQTYAPKALIIMACNDGDTEVRHLYYNATKEIALYYGLPFIDWHDDYWYTDSFLIDGLKSNHPTPVQYSGIAQCFERLFSKCVASYYEYFSTYHPSNPESSD